MIIVTHTGVDPWTMMIHLHDTSVTSSTMMRPRGLEPFTLGTKLELGPGLEVVWGPVQGQESGSLTEGAGEVVERQTGETGEQTGEEQSPGGLGGGPQHGGAVQRRQGHPFYDACGRGKY